MHRWMIERPNGPTSPGRCLVCGAEGEFKNSMPISGWDRDGSRAKKNNSNNNNASTTNTNDANKTSTDTKTDSKSS